MVAKTSRPSRSHTSVVPRAAPLRLPAAYFSPGTKPRLLPWTFAEQRLRSAKNYWICTTRPDRRPHAAPVWGVWMRGSFWFSTDPSSRKARNLELNPEVVVHLESGDEVVIIEGRARISEMSKELDRDYHRKYGVHLIGFPLPAVIFCVTPARIVAWREKAFPASATCWQLAGARSGRRRAR